MPIKTAKIDIKPTTQEEVEDINRRMFTEPNRIIRLKEEFYGDAYVIVKYLAVGIFFYGLVSLLQDVNII